MGHESNHLEKKKKKLVENATLMAAASFSDSKLLRCFFLVHAPFNNGSFV